MPLKVRKITDTPTPGEFYETINKMGKEIKELEVAIKEIEELINSVNEIIAFTRKSKDLPLLNILNGGINVNNNI